MASDQDEDATARIDGRVNGESPSAKLSPDVARKLAAMRSQVRESFGSVVMSMIAMPRYCHQSIADLQHILLDPLVHDRVAIAHARDDKDNPLNDVVGIAIWASVSDEVDAKIRAQIGAGAFPIRLKADEWTSGDTHWLLDVIAPDRKATATVIANFRQLVKAGGLKLHPMVAKLVDPGTLEKLGAQKAGTAL